ncbi:MAG: hypothetical protein WC998_00770 [Candidatus Paceibacterota bacterium]|jgi:hypothetical protein
MAVTQQQINVEAVQFLVARMKFTLLALGRKHVTSNFAIERLTEDITALESVVDIGTGMMSEKIEVK